MTGIRQTFDGTFAGGRFKAVSLAVIFAVAGLALVVEQANAAFGDDYHLIPINSGPGTLDVPAVPDSDRFFWAGACDRSTAPAAGSDLAPLGGIGTMPATTDAPNTFPVAVIHNAPLLGSVANCIDWRLGASGGGVGISQSDIWTPPPSWRLPAATRAGTHPDGSATFAFINDGDTDNVYVDLPPGFVGNPNAVPKCSAEQFAVKPQQCPPSTQVGVLTLSHQGAALGGANFGPGQNVDTVPVFNLEPRQGNVAELGLVALTRDARITARLVAKARTNSDFGVTTFIGQIPGSALPLSQQVITLWGVPWAAHNDVWRAPLGLQGGDQGCNKQPGTSNATSNVIPPGGLSVACRVSYDSSWGPIRPFLTTETDCNPSPVTTIATDVYQRPGPFSVEGDPLVAGHPDSGNWKTASSQSPAVVDCAGLPFGPDIDFTPTSDAAGSAQRAADSPAGLGVDLSVAQNNEPPVEVAQDPGNAGDPTAGAPGHWRSDAGRATAHLKDTVVSLPAGVAVNPSGATGLEGCSDEQFGVTDATSNPLRFNNEDPFDDKGAECPDGSIIGTARVDTPLLEQPLEGHVVLGTPKSTDPQSGQMFRLFLVVQDKKRGLIAKIFGSTKADPATGNLVATFENNPEVPFDRLRLQFKEGSRGLLRTAQRCGTPTWSTTFVPWSAAHGAAGASTTDEGSFALDQNCGFGFAPPLTAGMDNRQSRGHGRFSFEFSRQDGEQWFKGLTATLPTGLLAAVKDVPLCTDAQAAGNACPAGSRIGSVDASAGAGDPFVLERKGDVYLTEGYKGAPYGLAVSVPVEAGPFRGDLALTPIVVRQAIHVDRKTAQVTAVSDPFPHIWHGVPIAVRRVLVQVDRPAFMRNPSDCSPKQVQATLLSTEGTSATAADRFQASGCAGLPFKPKLTLALTGRKQIRTGKHPGVKAQVTQQGVGEAGIKQAVVRLPKSLALDVDNAQALCEFEDGTKPDLESHCPKGSIVGRARASTPLLKGPLSGNVYFVKNVRIDKRTGNRIRTLPMIVVALRGEIAINLIGESSTTKAGRLVNTFAEVPDAPVSQFNLNIRGGKNGILAVTRTRRAKINLCARPNSHIAEADMDAHNARRHDRDIRMKTPCRNRKAAARRGKS